MSNRLVSDELWNEIEHFFPEYEPSPLGGRPPVPNRVVLTGILFVFKTGIAWEDLPLELGCSEKTCKRRLAEWTDLSLWEQILRHLLRKLRSADGLELADVLIDAGLVKAPLGGQKPARTRPTGPVLAASIM